MPRTARVVVPGAPHHIIHRGNRRMRTFLRNGDYARYLAFARREFSAAKVMVWAYCLMPNHVHIIATPRTAEGLRARLA